MHGDIKSTNAIFSCGKDPQAYLIDFGLCFRPNVDTLPAPFQRGYYGSIIHTPPEMLQRLYSVNYFAAEMWAFGSICYWMLFGRQLPWENILQNYTHMPEKIHDFDLTAMTQQMHACIEKPKAYLEQKQNPSVQEKIALCVFKMLNMNPQRRLTSHQALETFSSLALSSKGVRLKDFLHKNGDSVTIKSREEWEIRAE